MRMMGKLVDIGYTSTEVRKIPYDLTFSLRYYKKTFGFFIRTSRRHDNTFTRIGEKLNTHFADLQKHCSLLQELPSMRFNTDDEEDNHFVLTVPPRTAVYSPSEVFFQTLGFGFHRAIETEYRSIEGSNAARNIPRKIVRGVFNEGFDAMVIRGEALSATGNLNANLFPNTEMPNTLPVQIELLEMENMVMPLPDTEDERQEATKANALRLLTMQMERIRQELGLKTNVLQVISGAEDVVYIGNRKFAGANMIISIEFNEDMAKAYGWTAGQLMQFPLEVDRTYEISIKGSHTDPFISRYPIVAKMAGFGSSNSYVDGQGYTAIMGYLRGGDHKIITNGILFDSDCTYVTLQFIDKQQKVVRFEDGHLISMLIAFTPL